MQSSEGTVTFKCEGCGVRKPEAERLVPGPRLPSVPKRA